ncbi:MAG: hypothetical protein ACKPBB_06805 [Sphaerospermopsis kisseleviana]
MQQKHDFFRSQESGVRSQEAGVIDFGFWILDCFCQLQSKI